MNKKTSKSIITFIFLTAAAGFSSPAMSHDFWLAPASYELDKPGYVDVSVMIGHPKDRLAWPVSPHRIIGLKSLGPDGLTDQQSAIADYQPSEALPIRLDKNGLHILTIETTSAISVLDAEKFNEYIEEEGLTPIKIDRVIKNKTDKPGRETYSRRGKSLIQLGEVSEIDPDYLLRPVGLTLEIVPLQNPARLKEGEKISSRIYYRGIPISGATVGLIDLDSDDGVLIVKKSDANGLVEFKRPKAGSWMQHVVWSDPLEDTRTADYDTIFSSLSFRVY